MNFTKSRNIQSIQFLCFVLIIILINYISGFFFVRFDLTAEKRYTLSDATKKLLKGLDDVVYFKIYLEGEFPSGFKRLRNATKEMLDEFCRYAKNNIEYEFINPLKSKDAQVRNQIIQQLIQKGLEPTNLQVKQETGLSQQIIFPGLIAMYKEREVPLQLLKNQIGLPPEQVLNNSIQALEYALASTIRKLKVIIKPQIAFIEGHGELSPLEVADITRSLSEYYEVRRIKINGQLNSLRDVKAIIIAQPDIAFDEKDKFIIDQFIMKGGKVFWLIDPVYANMDSLSNAPFTFAFPLSINLEDQLFKYGVRLNTNLILDIQSAAVPVNIAPVGVKPQFQMLPWIYFPLITPTTNHPIVNNLNAVKCEFVSNIDTIKTPDIKKTILLTTTKYSKLLNAPAKISLSVITRIPEEKEFNKPFQPIAVLLEGKFESVFKNRIPPIIAESKEIDFKEQSVENKMIIVSDGDIIRNQVHHASQQAYPLGYDKWTRETYGNKEFILNAVNYLLDEEGLISVRSRELKLRMLDKTKIVKEQTKWQIINVVLPLVIFVLFGVVLNIKRKRRYTTKLRI